MEFLLAIAAIWLSLGAIKGIIWAQQMPEFMGWWVFYQSGQDQEQSVSWYTKPKWIAFALFIGPMFVLAFIIFGPFTLVRERMSYFGPYGSAYIAAVAARHHKVKVGVMPGEFESWDDYMERLGDDPQQAANGLAKIPYDQLPDKIKDVIRVAEDLNDLQRRDVPEIDEDDEFRKDDE